jgi:Ribosomal protein L11 methylase
LTGRRKHARPCSSCSRRGSRKWRATGGVELAAYTDAQGEERLWHVFGGARAVDVADGWEDRWRTFHHPVQVGRLWVGPPWETPEPGCWQS